MGKIKILDCTLRDGGYCNQWKFGHRNIQKVVNALYEAHVDIIECGFLTNNTQFNQDCTRFTEIEQIAGIIPQKRNGTLFVCMVNYGEYDTDVLPQYDGSSVDGIRIAFHKKDLRQAMEMGRKIIQKGYRLFIQAMVSMSYSDREFLDLIEIANEINPYAFYIVDSFGVMKRNDLTRFFYLVENNLCKNIKIGYHAHNNMQLAYANAQTLTEFPTKRELIIDTSVYGMGRGAGNLNTELFVDYLNNALNSSYNLKPMLKVIDEVLDGFYNAGKWGYSLPYYLSAAHSCHPNYADYLNDKKTLTVENMDEIILMISDEKRNSFDKEYIERLYLEYMNRRGESERHLSEISRRFDGQKILIIAPGPSARSEKDCIVACASAENVVSIGINFDYPYHETDFIFLSNLRRFQMLDGNKLNKTIVTSNIPSQKAYLCVEYTQLLNTEETVKDNAGMMLLQFLIHLGVKDILIAGMDGYSHDYEENYAESDMTLVTRKEMLDEMNRGMSNVLAEYRRQTSIQFLTEPKYLQLQG